MNDRRRIAAWCLYDWANSPQPTVIMTFVFAAYFTRAVAPDAASGTFWWGQMTAGAGLVVAILAPVLGAIADRTGRRKPWIGVFTALTVVSTLCLWFVEPSADWMVFALVFVFLSSIGLEAGQVFYNATLSTVAPKDRIGRVSGWGWGAGYIGAIVGLGLCLVLFIQADPPLFGLDKAQAEHVRATAPFVALWFAVFSIPFFLIVPDTPTENRPPWGQAIWEGITGLIGTLRNLRNYRQIALFLLARLFYVDGLTTLFVFGGIYAAGTFGMTEADIIIFGIGLNVTAGLGAIAFAWIDDRIGPRATILVSLVALVITGTAALVVTDAIGFWVATLSLGIFIGPIQSASRSLLTRMAPAHMQTEMFGLFAFSGKATAFVGPMLVSWLTLISGSQRVGMASIVVFFVIGLVLMLMVKAPASGSREAG